MGYFTVEALDCHGKIVAEVDVSLTQFWDLTDRLEAEFQRLGAFNKDETIVHRLVPSARIISQDKLSMKVDNNQSLNFNNHKHGVHLLEPEGPLRSLSIWLFALGSQHKCSVSFPIDWLFNETYEHLKQRPVVQKKLENDEKIDFRVWLRTMVIADYSETTESPILLIVGSRPEVKPSIGAKLQEDITITKREPLI